MSNFKHRGSGRGRCVASAAVFLVLAASSAAHAAISTIYSFTGATADGATPYGSLVTGNGSTFYGMTSHGGNGGGDGGTIFSFNGTSDTILHSFVAADGITPNGSLVLSGSTLYGMTKGDGGITNYGTIYKVNTNGTQAGVVYTFRGGTLGQTPLGSLVLSGSTFYGMTSLGGSSGNGMVFSVSTNGLNYTQLHGFTGQSGDGGTPFGSLILDPNTTTLYGMTSLGGANGKGEIFKVNTTVGGVNNGYSIMHSFGDVSPDGATPWGSLLQSGNMLYGMTSLGGSHGKGSIFEIDTSGNNYNVLYSFGSAGEPDTPFGSLIISGTNLYGMAEYGGSAGDGAIFKLSTVDSTFTVLDTFGVDANGLNPRGDLLLVNNTLYGMTSQGGSNHDGTIFSADLFPVNSGSEIPEPSSLCLLATAGVLLLQRRRA